MIFIWAREKKDTLEEKWAKYFLFPQMARKAFALPPAMNEFFFFLMFVILDRCAFRGFVFLLGASEGVTKRQWNEMRIDDEGFEI